MKKPNKEAIIMFVSGAIALCVGVPVTLDGNAFGLGASVFGLSTVIMSLFWRD